jgi:F-type H+-transporting ATPase subunit b
MRGALKHFYLHRFPVLVVILALVASLGVLTVHPVVAQQQSTAQSSSSQQAEPNQPSEPRNQAKPDHKGMAGELVGETRESTGEGEEENANLKHASAVRWMAQKTGLSVHAAHMVALYINFAVIVVLVFWAGRKFLPAVFRDRSAAIQRSLEEARAASQDANRRLSDIENRLRQLDVEIGQMQASAEKEADAEEVRIQKATEEDIRKVVLGAEQEIAAAAKQARRELAAHTAGLAIALASKQINIDSNTDQMLVRSFASTLASENQNDNGNGNKEHGKDGR